jgi:hypothetical protein
MSTRGLLRILVFVGSIGLIPEGIYLLPNVKDNILGAVAGRQLDPVNWILTSRVAHSCCTSRTVAKASSPVVLCYLKP